MTEIAETTETEIATAADVVEAVARADTSKPYLTMMRERARRRAIPKIN